MNINITPFVGLYKNFFIWVYYYGWYLNILTLFFYKCVWLKSQTNNYLNMAHLRGPH